MWLLPFVFPFDRKETDPRQSIGRARLVFLLAFLSCLGCEVDLARLDNLTHGRKRRKDQPVQNKALPKRRKSKVCMRQRKSQLFLWLEIESQVGILSQPSQVKGQTSIFKLAGKAQFLSHIRLNGRSDSLRIEKFPRDREWVADWPVGMKDQERPQKRGQTYFPSFFTHLDFGLGLLSG